MPIILIFLQHLPYFYVRRYRLYRFEGFLGGITLFLSRTFIIIFIKGWQTLCMVSYRLHTRKRIAAVFHSRIIEILAVSRRKNVKKAAESYEK